MEGTSDFQQLLFLHKTENKGMTLEQFCINNVKYLQNLLKKFSEDCRDYAQILPRQLRRFFTQPSRKQGFRNYPV